MRLYDLRFAKTGFAGLCTQWQIILIWGFLLVHFFFFFTCCQINLISILGAVADCKAGLKELQLSNPNSNNLNAIS